MNKVFIHYDNTGKILSLTHELAMFFEERINNGEQVLEVPTQFDFKNFKLDLDTMTIVPKTPEEIEADKPKPINLTVMPPTMPISQNSPTSAPQGE